MRRTRLAWLACALVGAMTLVLGACGGGGGMSGDDVVADDEPPAPDANPNDPPDADNSDFIEIIGRDWSIPPGETYRCVRVLVEEDILINTFRPIAPDGTHHTVLTVSDQGPAGEYNCSAGSLDSEMLYASGVGTDDLIFPTDVAIRVEAGRYLNLNLHLFNTQPSGNLDGHSGILVKTVSSVTPDKEAEMVFAGTFAINIGANSSGTASGGCTFDDPATIFTYWPHMHQFATHQEVTLTVGGTAMTLHDEAYSFEEQRNYPITPIAVADGDRINVVCSYTNDTDQNVTFGDSSDTEMCFTGLYRYPKQAVDLFECSSPCNPSIGCPF
jgi:hypothetical protein